jgi:hypothetical protein
MRRLLLLAPITLLLACGSAPTAPEQTANPTPAFAASAFTDNFVAPLDQLVFIPCANGGVGEDVELTGRLHVLVHATLASDSNFVFKEHFQPQGIAGIGSVTGDTYHGTGATQDLTHYGRVGQQTFTFINNFRIIGQKTGNNLLLHEVVHFTVNANGGVTASFDKVTADCK